MRYKVFDVFANRPFEGNSTGVVYLEGKEDERLMQHIAAEFPVADTLFFTRKSSDDFLFACRTFSPFEELKICGQSLIAGIHALIEDREISPGCYAVETAVGVRQVFLRANGNATAVFCSLGCPAISEPKGHGSASISRLFETHGIPQNGMKFVDLGRQRLVVELPFPRLEKVAIDRAAIKEACRLLGIKGIIFFSHDPTAPGTVRSRFFTTSLDGAEDAVAGGAAGSILAFCRHQGFKGDHLQVFQGGFATRGGWIKTEIGSPDGEILIGGTAIKMLEGKIHGPLAVF